MYPVLLSIAGFELSSFSIFFILSWCVFSFVFWKSLRDEGVGEERIFDLTFYATLVALVSARVGFVAFHWDQFAGSILKVVALWVAPGLSMMSAVTAALTTMIILGRRAKVRVGAVLDAFGLAIPGALVVGSVGSLLDGSEVGKVTNSSWAIRYVGLPELRHPYQIYQIVALVMVLFVVGILATGARRKKWALGSVGIGFFLLWLPMLFGLEFLKDSRVYWYSLSANQWAALVLFSAAGVAWYMAAGGKFVVRHIFITLYAKFPKRYS
ncbi:prolipoprotein diacylglyceryl transferase [Candidatus Gottesmanbacteria bacterium]|nr:prolipoprotein diacylglyceryl transferase [Candidatus Gottesmanbacteria bacterium]